MHPFVECLQSLHAHASRLPLAVSAFAVVLLVNPVRCFLCFCLQPYFCIRVCTFSKFPGAGIVRSIASRVVQVAVFSFLTFVCEKITLDSCELVHNFCHSYGLRIYFEVISSVQLNAVMYLLMYSGGERSLIQKT